MTKYNTFGRWEVLYDNVVMKNSNKFLLCKCECGTERLVSLKNLKSGVSNNCGCVRNKKTSIRNTTHGKRFTKEWSIWSGMKQRCFNKKYKKFKDYGGRGITVCDEWKKDFMAFYNDMGEIPKGRSIDRIDNDGNYCKENCHWATRIQQSENRRSSRKINGICISYISKKLGGAGSLVGKRLKRGWSIQDAITIKSNALFNTKNSTVKV